MKQLFSGQEFFKMLKIGSIAALIVMTSLFFLPDRPDTYQIIMTKIIIIFFINIVPYFIAGVYCGKRLLGNSLSKSFWLVIPMPFVFMLVIIIKNPSWLTNISGIENLLMVAGGFGAFFYLIAFFVSFAGVSYGNHLSINRNKYYITPPFFKTAIIVMIIILLVVALKMFFG
jgi:hypothetical protein